MRSYQYKEPLALHGIELDIAPLFGDGYVDVLYAKKSRLVETLRAFYKRLKQLINSSQYDAIWIEKEVLPWLPAIFELALLPRRIPIIVDYDDAVFHRYDMHRSPIVRTILGRKLDHVMKRADLVVAGNDYLAARAIAAGCRHVEVVPTVVDLDRYPLIPRQPSSVLTVGWIGSPNTAPYLDIVKPAIDKLSSQIEARAIAIGARPEQVAGSKFVAVPWSEAGEVDALRDFDIGIMPLADTPWERGKCGYKLIQYMALGIPVIASPIGVNPKLVIDGVNGYLATTMADWLDALLALSHDCQVRAKFGSAGRSLVENKYSLSGQAPKLGTLLRAFTHTTEANG